MLKVYVETLGEYIEISEEGKFELPSRSYTSAELKKIAREINRASRKFDWGDLNED